MLRDGATLHEIYPITSSLMAGLIGSSNSMRPAMLSSWSIRVLSPNQDGPILKGQGSYARLKHAGDNESPISLYAKTSLLFIKPTSLSSSIARFLMKVPSHKQSSTLYGFFWAMILTIYSIINEPMTSAKHSESYCAKVFP